MALVEALAMLWYVVERCFWLLAIGIAYRMGRFAGEDQSLEALERVYRARREAARGSFRRPEDYFR